MTKTAAKKATPKSGSTKKSPASSPKKAKSEQVKTAGQSSPTTSPLTDEDRRELSNLRVKAQENAPNPATDHTAPAIDTTQPEPDTPYQAHVRTVLKEVAPSVVASFPTDDTFQLSFGGRVESGNLDQPMHAIRAVAEKLVQP